MTINNEWIDKRIGEHYIMWFTARFTGLSKLDTSSIPFLNFLMKWKVYLNDIYILPHPQPVITEADFG